MQEYKAVIFDMDGLLVDSEPLWSEVDKIVWKKRGLIPSDEQLANRVGTGHRNTVEMFKREFGITEDTDKLIAERLVIFDKLLSKLHLMDGAKQLIQKLYKKYELAIATGGYNKKGLLEVLELFGIKEYYSVTVGMDEYAKGKPNPDVFLLAAERLKVLPLHCLVLEDAPSGVLAGKAAGMMVYGVNKDETMRAKLKEAGADRVFASLEDIELID